MRGNINRAAPDATPEAACKNIFLLLSNVVAGNVPRGTLVPAEPSGKCSGGSFLYKTKAAHLRGLLNERRRKENETIYLYRRRNSPLCSPNLAFYLACFGLARFLAAKRCIFLIIFVGWSYHSAWRSGRTREMSEPTCRQTRRFVFPCERRI